MQRRCAYTRLFFVLSCYVLLLWLFISAHNDDDDWTTKVTLYISGTHYIAHSFVIPNNRIGWFPDRHVKYVSQQASAVVGSQRLKQLHQRNAVARKGTELNMCICINCARVINCSAYFFVETKHEQPHIAAQPTFTPRDGSPTIHVNIRTPNRTSSTKTTKDASFDRNNRIWSEEIKHAQRPKSTSSNTDRTTEGIDEETAAIAGETIIPISTTYTEYDVVACADYVEDMNCWIRNMPDEIKRANPNFVPT